jgi:16S rRNA processing protein RimM
VATDSEKWTVLAQIVRAQGRRGEVLAELLTDFPERFADRRRLFLLPPRSESSREMQLEGHWLPQGKSAGRVVLKFASIDSITDAETLRGFEVAIPREERAPLDEDAQYVGDLIGCSLIDVANDAERVVGVVEDVERPEGMTPILIVRRHDGDELLVPFARAYLRRIDVAAKRIEMALPDGLANLNAPISEEEREQKIAKESSEE